MIIMSPPVILPGEVSYYNSVEEAEKAMRKHKKEAAERKRKYLHQTK